MLLPYEPKSAGAQLRLQVEADRWAGLGDGWGQLTGRRARVSVTGRGPAVRAQSAERGLPDASGSVSVPEADVVAAGVPQGDVVAALG